MRTTNDIAVVGTSHTYQLPGAPAAAAFEAFIKSLFLSSNFAAIAEEMSIEALSERGATISVCKQVADKRGARHLYCDPDRQTRACLDIRQENGIRATAQSERVSEEEIRKRIQASHDRREEYWLDRIIKLDSWPLLFICGADHVDSFVSKAREHGLSVKVLMPDWSPTHE
jgi:hypothetical protein